MRIAAILAATGLLLICAGSPALAAKPETILVNALELDPVGNTFSESELRLNGRPFLMGQGIESGFLQNVSARPVVLVFSNGQVMDLAPGETVLLDPAADPQQKCLCRCGLGTDSRDLFPFNDITNCKEREGQNCLRGSDGRISTFTSCKVTYVNAAGEPVPDDDEPAEPGDGGEEAPIAP